MANNAAFERQARSVLLRYLAEAGIRSRWLRANRPSSGFQPDARLEIRLPGGERKQLMVEFKENARRAPLENALSHLRDAVAHLDAFPLLFSSHLGRPMRDWLRGQGVWFADLSGNRFFRGPGLYVDHEVAERPAEAREAAPSVFADKSSLILRYLLPRPQQEIGIRELAERIQISPAAVSVGLRRLQGMGYLEKDQKKLRLLDRENLLQEWVSFYRPRFRDQEESRFYVHARSAEAVIDQLRAQLAAKQAGYALSFHAGASLVAPFVQFREVHLYVAARGGLSRARLLQAVHAEKASGEANLVLLAPFYKGSVFFDARIVRGLRVVSDLQLYLDLSCFPQRGSEQAKVILERRLKPSWSGK